MDTPTDIYQRLTELGNDWAEKHAAADMFEETKKPLLAKLANESAANSQSAKESEALAHPEYDKHIRTMVARRKDANKAKVAYEAAKVWVDMVRTQAANERAANRHAT